MNAAKANHRLIMIAILVILLIFTFSLASAQEGGPWTPGTDQTDASAAATGTSFTYQGRLEENNRAANGAYDLRFRLFNALTGGAQVGSTLQKADQTVENGLFTVSLDFGAVFNSTALWLEVAVRPGASADAFEVLTPRQALGTAPYASYALGSPWAGLSGVPAGFADGVDNNTTYTASTGLNLSSGAFSIKAAFRLPQSCTNGQLAVWNGTAWECAAANNHNHWGANWYGDGTGLQLFSEETGLKAGGVLYGLYGWSTGYNGTGVYGSATASSGIGYGVYGTTVSTNGIGVVGVQTGYSPADHTLWNPGGLFGGRNGVVGISKENGGYGVSGISKATSGDYSIGIYASADSPTGWAGYFWSTNGNGVYISAKTGKSGLNVAGGTKNAVVGTDAGSYLLYSEESTQVWFSDYGFGKLSGGAATILIDPLFAQTVNLAEPYHVFIQVYGNAEVYVSNRMPQSFEVHLREGDPDVEFSYRLVASRLGYENDRLEPAPWADEDPNLYPEKGLTNGQQN